MPAPKKRSASHLEGLSVEKKRSRRIGDSASALALPSTSRQSPTHRSFRVIYLAQIRSTKFRYTRTYSRVSVRVPVGGAVDLSWLSNYLGEVLEFFDSAHDTVPSDLVGLSLEAVNSSAQPVWVAVRKRRLITVDTILDAISSTIQSHDIFQLPGTLYVTYTHIKLPTAAGFDRNSWFLKGRGRGYRVKIEDGRRSRALVLGRAHARSAEEYQTLLEDTEQQDVLADSLDREAGGFADPSSYQVVLKDFCIVVFGDQRGKIMNFVGSGRDRPHVYLVELVEGVY